MGGGTRSASSTTTAGISWPFTSPTATAPSRRSRRCSKPSTRPPTYEARCCNRCSWSPTTSGGGPSFIAARFREALAGIRIAATGFGAISHVRIGYRLPTQLGLLERFHGTLKREEVYWNLYADPCDARQKLAVFHERYNLARPHWALIPSDPTTTPASVLTPHEVYMENVKVDPPSWSRWVGWLQTDQDTTLEPPSNSPLPMSA